MSNLVYDTTNDDDDDDDNDDMSNDKDKETDLDVFFWAAQVIMNWSNKKIGPAAIEGHQFHSFFGARQEIVKMVWDMLGEGGLHPKKSEPSRKPPRYVPYKCIYVPYNDTFGTSDQGQTLDV